MHRAQGRGERSDDGQVAVSDEAAESKSQSKSKTDSGVRATIVRLCRDRGERSDLLVRNLIWVATIAILIVSLYLFVGLKTS